MSDSAGDLARTWLRAWDTHDLALLRLTPDFVHTSPFGRIEGREKYLEIVEAMSKENVLGLKLRDVIEAEDRAAITYDMETRAGIVEACDWVFVADGKIREINSFYDRTALGQ